MLRRFDFAEQLWVVKGENNIHPCEAELSVDLASLDRLGPPTWEDDPHDWTEGMPPSPSRGWQLVAECGLEFVLYQDWFPWDGVLDHACVVAGTQDEIDHALMHLPFAARVTGRTWYRFGTAFDGGWEVRRVDDSGNGFSVGRYPREASACCVAKIFEERAHKQTYFVDVLGPPPRVAVGEWLVMRMDDNGQVFPFARTAAAALRSATCKCSRRRPGTSRPTGYGRSTPSVSSRADSTCSRSSSATPGHRLHQDLVGMISAMNTDTPLRQDGAGATGSDHSDWMSVETALTAIQEGKRAPGLEQ